MPMAVVVTGSSYNGFKVVGPFKTEADADAYAEQLNENAQMGADGIWVHELVAPEGADE